MTQALDESSGVRLASSVAITLKSTWGVVFNIVHVYLDEVEKLHSMYL